MIKKLLTFLLICTSIVAFGQFQRYPRCFSNVYIDRPFVSSDSSAIISNHVTKIKLYERISNDSLPKKKLIGQWNVVVENDKITSTKWVSFVDSTYSSEFFMDCYPLIKRSYSKNKIVDIIEYNDNSGRISRFQLTHLFNKYGQIYQTNNKILGTLIENRYSFDKIEYRYDGKFLTEIDYFSSILYLDNYTLYTKLFYEYE